MIKVSRRRHVQLLVVAGENGVVTHGQDFQVYRGDRLRYVDVVGPFRIVQHIGMRVQPLGRELLIAVPDDEEDVAIVVPPS